MNTVGPHVLLRRGKFEISGLRMRCRSPKHAIQEPSRGLFTLAWTTTKRLSLYLCWAARFSGRPKQTVRCVSTRMTRKRMEGKCLSIAKYAIYLIASTYARQSVQDFFILEFLRHQRSAFEDTIANCVGAYARVLSNALQEVCLYCFVERQNK